MRRGQEKRLSNVWRERGLWSRSLVLVALVSAGTACGGGGDGRSAGDHGATIGRAAEVQAAADGQRQVVSPSPVPGEDPKATVERVLSQVAPVIPPPPAPDLGIGRPQVPPNTVSLEALHQQGRTHVLR